MRFKASLAWRQAELLCHIVTSISRLNFGERSVSSLNDESLTILGSGRGAIMCLDPDQVRISVRGGSGACTHHNIPISSDRGGNGAEGVSCFSELSTGIFMEHRVESAAKNVIVFEISLVQLRMVLQSILASARAAPLMNRNKGDSRPLYITDSNKDVTATTTTSSSVTSSTIVMKLAKRNRGLPCLCLDLNTKGKGGIEVHNAIPVHIMKVADMQYHFPPEINMPTVQLELPADRPLRTVVERLKNMSPHVYIEGSMKGELVLRMEEKDASIRTFYKNMIPRFEDCKMSVGKHPRSDEHAHCTLKVDTKKLHACLHWQSMLAIGLSITSAVLCMVENEILVLHIILNPSSLGFFTYYIPVHFLSEDDDS